MDARNVRNIVLMRPINSMIEFKQIIGRGTRLFDGKDYFTIFDFVKAYEHFNDPEWDGEPLEPSRRRADAVAKPDGAEGPEARREPAAAGKAEEDQDQAGRRQGAHHPAHDGDEFWSPDGKPMSAQQIHREAVRRAAGVVQGRGRVARALEPAGHAQGLLEGLAEKGFGGEQLAEISRMIDAEKSDLFDVLAYIAFALAPMTRAERVEAHARRYICRLRPEACRRSWISCWRNT